MRACVITAGGGIDSLEIVERPVPECGPQDVLVSTRASALNYRDLSTVLDPVSRGLPLPLVPNSDGAGEVVAVGAEVQAFKSGDRVMSCFFQSWPDGEISTRAMASALGGPLDGMLSEYCLLKATGTMYTPPHLDDLQASTLPCAGLTAWRCLVDVGGISADSTIVLLGTGGVSVFALQFAKAIGARVIMTSGNDGKLELCKSLGADETINYRQRPDWHLDVLEMTDGNGADLVLEIGGGGSLVRSVQAVRVGGTIPLIGTLAQGTFDPMNIMRKSIRLQGVYVGSAASFKAMNAFISEHRIQPRIDKVFAFEQARDAYRHLQAAGHFGKLVVRLG